MRGKRHATFDVAGAGNEMMAAGLKATAKAVEHPPEPNVGAPYFYTNLTLGPSVLGADANKVIEQRLIEHACEGERQERREDALEPTAAGQGKCQPEVPKRCR